jgi:signal transduction histidine kinase
MDIYLLNQILLVALFGIGGPLGSLKMLYPYLRDQEIEFEKKINKFQFVKLVSQQNSIFIFEDLVSNLIHDVNNSLTGVINFSDFINEEVDSQPSSEINDRVKKYSCQLQNESNKIEKKMKLLSQLSHTDLKYENLVSVGLLFEHMNSLVATGLKKSGIEIEYKKNDELNDVKLKFDFRILLITIIKCISLLKTSVIFNEDEQKRKKRITVTIDFIQSNNEIVSKVFINCGQIDVAINDVLNSKISVSEIFNNETLRNNKSIILALSLVNSIETNPIYLSMNFHPNVENSFEIRIINQRIDFER